MDSANSSIMSDGSKSPTKHRRGHGNNPAAETHDLTEVEAMLAEGRRDVELDRAVEGI